MLSVTALNASGKSIKNGCNVLQYLISVEYYRNAQGEKIAASQWWGKGAADLGLEGAPTEEQMLALAGGFAPDENGKKGRALCRNAGSPGRERVTSRKDKDGNFIKRIEGAHRVGDEWTFSAPKGLSVAFAAADPVMRDKILKAQDIATKTGLAWLQNHAETRRRAGGKDVIGAELVVSIHPHVASRAVETGDAGGAGDPQLHSHCLVYAVCRGEDGKWGKISGEEMRRQLRTASAIYRASLAYEMRKLGFGITKEVELDSRGNPTGDVYFGIEGISKSVELAFSKRRAEVLDYMAANPTSSAQAAALATRKDKDEPPLEELVAIWNKALIGLRQDDPKVFKSVDDLLGRPDNFGEPVSDQAIIDRLHENEAVWTRGNLVERIALENVGRLSVEDILKEADVLLERNNIVHVAAPEIHAEDKGRLLAIRHREANYASPDELAREKVFVERALARKDDAAVSLDVDRAKAFISEYQQANGFVYQPEQTQVIESVIGEGGTVVIGGRAGTGKTFTSAGWIGALKDQGRDVIGAAISWKAAKKLESESGIESFSTAALLSQLERGTTVLHNRSVVVLDEAAMAGTKTVLKLQEFCDAAKAKLVLQGDELQLQPITSGAPFRLAANAVGEVHLSDIRRQNSQTDRDTATAFYDRDAKLRSRRESKELGMTVLSQLEKNEQLASFELQEEAVANLVHDYLKSATADREKLALGGTNADVAILNRAIRKGLKDSGRLTGQGVTVSGLDGHKNVKIELTVGDRVRFAEGNRDIGVFNGEVAVVESMDLSKGRTRLVARLESDIAARDGKRVEVDAEAYGALSYGYATTVHKAQGQGVAEVFQLANLGMTDRQLALVSFTRMKSKYCLYGTHNALDAEVLAERMGTDRLKVNATDRLAAKKQQEAAQSKQRAKREMLGIASGADQTVARAGRRKTNARRASPVVQKQAAPAQAKVEAQQTEAVNQDGQWEVRVTAKIKGLYNKVFDSLMARIGRAPSRERGKIPLRTALQPKPNGQLIKSKPVLPPPSLRPPGSDKPWLRKPGQTRGIGR